MEIEWMRIRNTTDGFLTGRLVGRVSEIDHYGEPVHFDALDARTKPFVRIGSFKTLKLALFVGGKQVIQLNEGHCYVS